jgi:hypothetical protein
MTLIYSEPYEFNGKEFRLSLLYIDGRCELQIFHNNTKAHSIHTGISMYELNEILSRKEATKNLEQLLIMAKGWIPNKY